MQPLATMPKAMQDHIRKYAKCADCRKDGLRSEMVYGSNTGRGQLIYHSTCLYR
jgi:fructose/tagatose bisphosphate aldolase